MQKRLKFKILSVVFLFVLFFLGLKLGFISGVDNFFFNKRFSGTGNEAAIEEVSSYPIKAINTRDISKEQASREVDLFNSDRLEKNKQFHESVISDDLKCADCNIIVISATNVRKDHLSLYGYGRNTSPNLDNFSKDAIVLENAYAPSSWTLPNSISLLTSLFPYEHKIQTRQEYYKLSSHIVTLPDVLKENGYKTAAFTGSFDYDATFGAISRFDWYKYGKLSSFAGEIADWVGQNKDKKFFLLVQGFDAHCPFNPKEPYNEMFTDPKYSNPGLNNDYCYVSPVDRPLTFEKDGKTYYNVDMMDIISKWDENAGNKNKPGFTDLNMQLSQADAQNLRDLYDGEIKEVDDAIGKIFKKVKDLHLDNKTIIVFLSDHGDLHGENGYWMRGGPARGLLYESVVNIPVIIKNPKLSAKKVDNLAQTVDIMPTILDFLGISATYFKQGESLVPAILNDKEVHNEVFSGAIYGTTPQPRGNIFEKVTEASAVRTKEWKLIKTEVIGNVDSFDGSTEPAGANYQLYNIAKDPKEAKELQSENKDIFENLKKDLRNWESQFGPYLGYKIEK